MKSLPSIPAALAAVSALLVAGSSNQAHADSTDRSGVGLVDNLIDSSFNPTKSQADRLAVFSTPDSKLRPFLATREVYVGYEHDFAHGKTSGADLSQDGARVGLFLDSRIGLSFAANFHYGAAETTFPFGGTVDTDNYTANWGTGLELLHFVRREAYNPQARTALVLGANFGYSYASPQNAAPSRDSWLYGGFLSFRTQIIENRPNHGGGLLLTITPSYSDVESSVDVPVPVFFPPFFFTTRKVDTSTSVFSLDARLDYALCSAATLTAFGRWNHDVNQTTLPFLFFPPPQYQNWAEFGGGFTVNLARPLQLKAGGSYEAFNSLYYAWTANFSLNYFF